MTTDPEQEVHELAQRCANKYFGHVRFDCPLCQTLANTILQETGLVELVSERDKLRAELATAQAELASAKSGMVGLRREIQHQTTRADAAQAEAAYDKAKGQVPV